jgi:hypothetical protein
LEFAIEFTATTNVRAIKGHVIKHVFHHHKLKTEAKKITVTLKGKTLNLRQNLGSIDWEEDDVIVATFD